MQRDVDDCSLQGSAILWRAINPTVHIKPDGSASTGAYKTRRLSVYAIAETTPQKLRSKPKVGGWPWQWFTVKQARDAGCIVVKIADDYGDESHREVCPADDPASRLQAEAIAIADVAQWVDGHAPGPKPLSA